MGYKGVVFDFNGTLFLDTDLHNKAWDIFLKNHAIKLSDADKNKMLHGKNNRDIMKNLFGPDLASDVSTFYIQEKEAIYRDICSQSKRGLAPGAEDFIYFLKSKQIKYTIATASIWENVEFYFNLLRLHQWFELENIVYDNGAITSKPAPDFFIKACNQLEIPPQDVIVFEDSLFGIKAAENANVGRIIIFASNKLDYSRWNHEKITSYVEVDRTLFETV